MELVLRIWLIGKYICFRHVINRWCGDHHKSDLTDALDTTTKATLVKSASTKSLTTFLMTVKTGVRTSVNINQTPSIYVFFVGQFGSSPVIHLNDLTDRVDVFQSLETDEFTFTIPDTGMVTDKIFLLHRRVLKREKILILAEHTSYMECRKPCSMDM